MQFFSRKCLINKDIQRKPINTTNQCQCNSFLLPPLPVTHPPALMSHTAKRQEIFGSLLKTYCKILYWTGLDVLTEIDFARRVHLGVLFINIVLFLGFNIYSIVVFRYDILALVFSVVVIGFWFSAMVALSVVVVKAKDMRKHYLDIVDFLCTEEESGDPAVEAVKDKYINYIFILSKLYIVVFMSSGVCISLLPLLRNAVTGSRELIFGIIIPFCDPQTTPGFAIIYGFQLLQVAYWVCGFPAFQFIYTTMILHSCCVMEVMATKMQPKWQRGSPRNILRLRGLFQLHQLQIGSLAQTQRIFEVFNFNQMICTVVQATLTAFILIYESWLQGYVLFLLAIVVFFVSCLHGEFLQVKAKQLEVAVFNTMQWHKLSHAERGLVTILLLATQKKQHLQCGKIFTLGLSVFMSVGS